MKVTEFSHKDINTMLESNEKENNNDGRMDVCFSINKSHTSWTKPSKPISAI